MFLCNEHGNWKKYPNEWGGEVSKETVVVCPWESTTGQSIKWAAVQTCKADIMCISPLSDRNKPFALMKGYCLKCHLWNSLWQPIYPINLVDNSKLPLKKSLFSHKKLNFRPLSFMCQCSAAVLREFDNKFGKYMNINLCMRSDKCLACY